MDTLTSAIEDWLSALDAQSSLYARDLSTGQEIAIRADEPVNTLSVIKIPIMVRAFQDVDAGTLDLDERYTLRSGDLRRGSGLLQTFDLGLQPTYHDLITQMIITSDNTATDILIARVGQDRVNAMLAGLGYEVTRLQMTTGDLFRRVWEMAEPAHRSLSPFEVFERGFPNDAGAADRSFALSADAAQWLGRSTAREMGRMLEQLERGELASPASTEAMRRTLLRQFYSSRLPQRISFRVSIGHKTGDWPPIAGNDVGILFAPGGPIVISLFITHNRGSFLELEATHGAIAEAILDAWSADSA